MGPARYAVLIAACSATLPPASAQPRAFAFAGMSLAATLEEIATRYPHSMRNGNIIYVDPQDTRDHISAIALSGGESAQVLRIMFEVDRSGRPEYPSCAELERRIAAQFGAPTVRTFVEEAVRRADRHWQSATEEMTLVCFGGRAGELLAEAVVIGRTR